MADILGSAKSFGKQISTGGLSKSKRKKIKPKKLRKRQKGSAPVIGPIFGPM